MLFNEKYSKLDTNYSFLSNSWSTDKSFEKKFEEEGKLALFVVIFTPESCGKSLLLPNKPRQEIHDLEISINWSTSFLNELMECAYGSLEGK